MKQLLFLLFLLCSIVASATEQVKENSSEVKEEGSTNVKHFNGYSPKMGLKGFVEGGYTISGGYSDQFRLSLLGTIGWQFSPCFFVGIGSGEVYYTDSKQYSIPLYTNFRLNNKSLFLEVRAGYSIADVKGLYFSPSFGCRVGTKNNTAFIFSMGYEYQKANNHHSISNHFDGLTTRIGFEF